MNRRLATVTAILAVALIVAACQSSGSLGTVPPLEPTPEPSLGSTPPDVTPAPSGTPVAAPSQGAQSPTPAPSQTETMVVRAYFVLSGEPGVEGLVPYLFEVPKSPAIATAAMNALLTMSATQRDGYAPIFTAIPAGTKLLGLTIDRGVATVDLSSEFASGGGSASSQFRLAQVTYTLTQFPTVSSVLFKVDGEVVSVFGSEGIVLNGPQARDDFEDQLPAIFVDRPASGASIGNPGRVAGNANVFEATFRIAILDREGRVLVDEMAMATCGTGCRGTFDETYGYNVSVAQWGTLKVYAGSAVDGSPQDVREYPVWLTPAD